MTCRSQATFRATGGCILAGMNEGGGGFPHNDINHIFKSTDGGNTWTHPLHGFRFPGTGRYGCWLLCLHV